jgi:hypothetical protein
MYCFKRLDVRSRKKTKYLSGIKPQNFLSNQMCRNPIRNIAYTKYSRNNFGDQ